MAGLSISLVLGSGGARGLAHIGAIQCLEAEGYEIRYISGSSIGALVGGIHAAGKLDDYTQWVKALRRKDVVQLLDFGWGRGGGIFKGERIIDVLKELIGDRLIERLPIGFTAVATDLRRKREVWFTQGPLFSAIRASIAIPLVFAPVTSGNQLLLDGGILNPLPIAPTLNDETDLIVAVDVNGPDERAIGFPARPEELPEVEPDEETSDDPGQESFRQAIAGFVDSLWPSGSANATDHGMFDVAVEAMDAMQASIARHKLAVYSPDVTIQIPRNTARFFEFERAGELIEIGRARMAAAMAPIDASN